MDAHMDPAYLYCVDTKLANSFECASTLLFPYSQNRNLGSDGKYGLINGIIPGHVVPVWIILAQLWELLVNRIEWIGEKQSFN